MARSQSHSRADSIAFCCKSRMLVAHYAQGSLVMSSIYLVLVYLACYNMPGMSGHSKWSTIKHKKEALDHKRGNLFTKLAKAIIVSVRKGGGGDPATNFSLRLAIDKARAANMPKDNIKRAIVSGLGKATEGRLEEFMLEGYGPSGIAVIIEVVTDNRNRTVSEIKNTFEKAGGSLAEPGAVLYQFERKGYVSYDGKLSDEIFLLAVDSGAEDLIEEGEGMYLVTSPELVKKISEILKSSGVVGIKAGTMYKSKVVAQIEDSKQDKARSFLKLISDHDDVQEVYSNVEA